MSFLSQFEKWVHLNQVAWKDIKSRNNWIRLIRQERGLKGKELAQRMALSAARISVMEKEEANGALSLKMMCRAAEALDCEFVYALIPKTAINQPSPEKPKIRINAN